jgi:hypothetical protein
VATSTCSSPRSRRWRRIWSDSSEFHGVALGRQNTAWDSQFILWILCKGGQISAHAATSRTRGTSAPAPPARSTVTVEGYRDHSSTESISISKSRQYLARNCQPITQERNPKKSVRVWSARGMSSSGFSSSRVLLRIWLHRRKSSPIISRKRSSTGR